jgi:hypothetical protein
MELVGAALLALLYFLPWANALLRGHLSTTAIFFFNLLLGWTFLGWVIALVWSFSANTERNALYDQQRLRL